jgi:hypothetical protein
MAIEYPGNAIPNAGFSTGNRTVDDELLVSSNGGFTQKGVTLKAGQGVLPLGTILARETTTKKYVKYAAGGANGAGTARGILRSTVDTGTDAAGQEYNNNIVQRGILNLTKIKAANPDVTDLTTILGARTDDVWNTFTF